VREVTAGGHPPQQLAGVGGGHHQDVGPQNGQQPGSAEHGGENA